MRLFAVDLLEGFRSMGRLLPLVPALAAALTGTLLLVMAGAPTEAGPLTLGDMLTAQFSGMAVYRPETNYPFVPPVPWLLICLLLLLLPLHYPYRDLKGFGLQAIVGTSSRIRWWASKCLWLGIYVLLFWTLAALVALAATVAVSGEFTLAGTQDAAGALALDTWDFVTVPRTVSLAPAIGAAVLMSWALCLVQLALALWIRPVLAYGALATLLIGSAFFLHPLLPGEYLMLGRSAPMIKSGVDPAAGAVLAAVIGAASVLLGAWRFSRMDIIDREFSS